MDAKELINLTLDFYKYKLNNDLLTVEDIDSIADMIKKNLKIFGTAEDFARFFDTTESHVRQVIARSVIDKPKRRVYHNFISFIQNAPSKLLKKRELR